MPELASEEQAGATLLIVEDETIVALDIQARLVRLGYKVCSRAVSGQEAIDQALQHQPDLILMDIRLQGSMDGIQAAHQIRRYLAVPIVYLTAYADADTLQRARITDPHGYLIKPFEERELQITIELALHKHAMERRARQQAEQMEQIVNSIPEGVVLLDPDRHILLANPRARHLLMLLFNTSAVEDDTRSLSGSRFQPVFDNPDQFQEFRVGGKKKQILEIMGRKVNGQPRAQAAQWLLIIRDVTEEREQLARYRQQAHLAGLGRLAAGIAHDFNNILAIISTAEHIVLVTQNNLTTQNREFLITNREQVRRGSTLVKQLLDFSRAAAEEVAPMDMVPLLKEIGKSMALMMPDNITLRVDCGPEPQVVNADPGNIQQVMINLVTNARDAMPKGGVLTLSLSHVQVQTGETAPIVDLEPGEWVRLSVTDSGEGIPASILPHVFEPFFTTKPFGQGTGLGLAQVFGIVEQYNGRIHVTSRPEEMTVFDVYLPCAGELLPEAELETEFAMPDHEWKGSREMILLVEDEAQLRDHVRTVLELFNYQVLDASNGREALEIWESTPGIRLIISDVVMPRMGGVELCRTVKAREPEFPFIMMTGYSSSQTASELAGLGVTECLQKPVTIEEFARAVGRVLKAGK
ncbi:MAG: response regulator [Chloroflexi bacterium]|nr:response regulator [Chloroflexota bacterium]